MFPVNSSWSWRIVARRAPRPRYLDRVQRVDLPGWSSAGAGVVSHPGELAVIGAGFGVSWATAYRYRDEVITGWPRRPPISTMPRWTSPSRAGRTSCSTGSCSVPNAAPRPSTSVKGETINAWFRGSTRSGRERRGRIRPDGLPIWVSDVAPATSRPDRGRDTGVFGRAVLVGRSARPARPRRLRLLRHRPGQQDSDQAAHRWRAPGPGQPGLQHADALGLLSRRMWLRPADLPLASTRRITISPR